MAAAAAEEEARLKEQAADRTKTGAKPTFTRKWVTNTSCLILLECTYQAVSRKTFNGPM
jgi:hypothetical protein